MADFVSTDYGWIPSTPCLVEGARPRTKTLLSRWIQSHFGSCAGKVPVFISTHVAHSRFSLSNRSISSFAEERSRGYTFRRTLKFSSSCSPKYSLMHYFLLLGFFLKYLDIRNTIQYFRPFSPLVTSKSRSTSLVETE